MIVIGYSWVVKMNMFPGVTAAALAAKEIFNDIEGIKTKDIIVVVFTTGPKKYAYYNNGSDISVGDTIIVPTESGNDLEATVVIVTNAKRWAAKATKTIR